MGYYLKSLLKMIFWFRRSDWDWTNITHQRSFSTDSLMECGIQCSIDDCSFFWLRNGDRCRIFKYDQFKDKVGGSIHYYFNMYSILDALLSWRSSLHKQQQWFFYHFLCGWKKIKAMSWRLDLWNAWRRRKNRSSFN